MSRIAVITGDLINSTKVRDAHGFRARLEELMELLERNYQARTMLYRGDGFQAVLDAERFNALEVAVIIRTGLIAQSPDKNNRWDARVALAFDTGDGDGKLSFEDQNSSAFVNSGRLLDEMDKDHFSIYGSNENTRLALGVATGFVDDIVNQLTPTEAEVLHYFFLDRKSHSDIARQLGKKRPTITLALHRARYTLIDRFVQDMNKFLVQGDD
ncbi:MAG: sigma-70 region 4 domain-containing protein [Gammaproteobacteria bacterium]